MRSPINDANAGAATQVAPTVKHANRAATIAKHHSNKALQEQANYNVASSALGQAIGGFLEQEHQSQAEQRYFEAYNNPGQVEGTDEYAQDIKRTGFTKWLYNGKQSPEYMGKLNAATQAAASAMYVRESEFIEDEGAEQDPATYHKNLANKVRDFVGEQFQDAPDAAMAFMKNWEKASNTLSKQHAKLYPVRQQQKARRIIEDGFQESMSHYKQLIKHDPKAADEYLDGMLAGVYIPNDVSKEVATEVLLGGAMTAMEAGDYTGFKMLERSGMGMNEKQTKRYHKAVAHLDSMNAKDMNAARLRFQTVQELDDLTPDEFATARQRYDSEIIQIAARNTNTPAHYSTSAGADRWRGEISNRHAAALKKAYDENVELDVEFVGDLETEFDRSLESEPDPLQKRKMVADRLDSLEVQLFGAASMPRDQREALREQSLKYKKLVNKWDSTAKTKQEKLDKKAAKLKLEQDEITAGIRSLQSGNGVTSETAKVRKAQVNGAVTSVLQGITGDINTPPLEQLAMVFQDPRLTKQFSVGLSSFRNFSKESSIIKTGIENAVSSIFREDPAATGKDNKWTEKQKQTAQALMTLQEQASGLYVNALDSDLRDDVNAVMNAIKHGKGVAETIKQLDTIALHKDKPVIGKQTPEDLITKVGKDFSSDQVKRDVYDEYLRNLPLGENAAFAAAQTYAFSVDEKVLGYNIRDASTFKHVGELNLESVMRIMNSTYNNGRQFTSGFSAALAEVNGSTKDANGDALYKLDQVPNLDISIFDGRIRLESNHRVSWLHRGAIEEHINGYNNWRASHRVKSRPIGQGSRSK